LKNLTALKNFIVLSLTSQEFRFCMYSDHDSRFFNVGKYKVPMYRR
tara:strand:- start:89 stop:226 length:138 start_codon:yes stop_codon:yes gene_type:complete